MTKEPWEDNFAAFAPLVMASTQVMGPNRLPVCYAFRQEPNNEYDSGWHFWSGSESQEFVDNSENFGICPLKSFLDMDASLKEILDTPVGSAWEREPGGEWSAVEINEDESD